MEVGELKQTTLAVVPEDKAFYTSSRAVHDIHSLADAIEEMPEEEFERHTGGENDFASWVEHVLHNKGLAEDLRLEANETDRAHCAKTLRDHAAWLESV